MTSSRRAIRSMLTVVACAFPATSCSQEARDAMPRASHLTLTAISSSQRVTAQNASTLTGPDSITIDAARGEREGAQLIIGGAGRDDLTVTCSPLIAGGGAAGGTLGAAHVVAYLEQPVRITQPSPGGQPGTYLDALMPASEHAVAMDAHSPVVAWIDAAIPREQAPGTYTGAVTVARKHGAPATMPITVRVHAVTLPTRPTLASSVGVDASQLVRFEGVTLRSPGLNTMFDRYAGVLGDARLSPADFNIDQRIGTDPAFAKSDQDVRIQRLMLRNGITTFRVPMYATFPYPDPLGTDRDRTLTWLRNVAAYLRAHGWLDRSYVYVIDEPTPDRFSDVGALHDLVHEADPGLRLLVTTDYRAALHDDLDIWAGNISPAFHAADVAVEHDAGHQAWWYPSISTHTPYPTLFIDDPRPSPRALGWLAARHHLDGVLYWSATHWHEVSDPWTSPRTYRNPDDGAIGNGDGSLLYPGRPRGLNGPAPSVRLLQLRDGLEDADLIAAARSGAQGLAARTFLDSVASSDTSFAAGGFDVDAAHRALLVAVSS